MKKYEIKSFQQFHSVLQKYNSDTIYRGVSRSSYKLLPKVGRDKCINNYNKHNKYGMLVDYEDALLLEFQKFALPFIENSPQSQWEWWAIHNIAPSIVNSTYWNEYDKKHHEHCPGCNKIQAVAYGASGKSQGIWKGITMSHYIYTIDQYSNA